MNRPTIQEIIKALIIIRDTDVVDTLPKHLLKSVLDKIGDRYNG